MRSEDQPCVHTKGKDVMRKHCTTNTKPWPTTMYAVEKMHCSDVGGGNILRKTFVEWIKRMVITIDAFEGEEVIECMWRNRILRVTEVWDGVRVK